MLCTCHIRNKRHLLTCYIERGCFTFFPKSTFMKNTQDTPKPFPLPLLLYNHTREPKTALHVPKKIKKTSEYRFSWGWNFRRIVRHEFRRLKRGLCIKSTIGNIQHMSVTYRSLSKYFAFSCLLLLPMRMLTVSTSQTIQTHFFLSSLNSGQCIAMQSENLPLEMKVFLR